MINIYVKQWDRLAKVPYDPHFEFHEKPVWIDLINMTREEELYAEKILGINVPSIDEMKEIELSSRLYHRDNAINMTASIISANSHGGPEINAVTFVIFGNTIVTVRYCDPLPFQNYISVVEKLPESDQNAGAIFVDLLEYIVARIADIVENAGKHIDEMAKQIFLYKNLPEDSRIDLREMLGSIGMEGDIISKLCESLVTLNRVVSYAKQSSIIKFEDHVVIDLNILLRDITALNDHAIFLSNKVSFLLDATLGVINLEQNSIIKIFSVASVLLMPPTFIASIYGMNFHNIPELNWQYGYPAAIACMLLSAWIPYKFFKRKKWL